MGEVNLSLLRVRREMQRERTQGIPDFTKLHTKTLYLSESYARRYDIAKAIVKILNREMHEACQSEIYKEIVRSTKGKGNIGKVVNEMLSKTNR